MPPLIEVKHLTKHYPYKKLLLKAVQDVTFNIYPGETLGLVGESGCGKSTLGKLLLRLEEKTAGDVLFSHTNIFDLPSEHLKAWRKKAQPIFQDPYASLNPRMTAREILKEPFQIHGTPTTETHLDELFLQVGLDPSSKTRYPHEFSSGQRQRIAIARALSLNPQFLVCDEAIASLDIATQVQIINLLKNLQKTLNLTYLFISHDLRMMLQIADRIAVMYLGNLVEIAPALELYKNPLHPYTQALFSALTLSDPLLEKKRPRNLLQNDPPSPLHPPSGCKFCTRCPKVLAICNEINPPLKEVSPDHLVACCLYK